MAVTWADIVARGSGQAEFRAVIEGSPLVFCTAGMTLGTSSADAGAERVGGLQREGLGFEETCYFAGAEQRVSIQPVQIADVGVGANRGRATWLFSTIARVVDYVGATIQPSDTTVTVRSSALFSISTAYYYAGTETFLFTAAPLSTTLTASRAQFGSTAQSHYRLLGRRSAISAIYDHPPGFVSRRVWLYAHGSGETGTSDAGTIVWRGIIGKEPSESNGVWTLQVEPRTKLLDGPLAGGFGDGFKLRGIYYPGRAPLQILVNRYAGATADHSTTPASVYILISGFHETQSAFCQYVTDTLNADATIVSWGVSFEARIADDGGWDLYFRTATGTARYIEVLGGSVVDGWFDGTVLDEFDAIYRTGSAGTTSSVAGTAVTTITADSIWRAGRTVVDADAVASDSIKGSDLRRVPRSNQTLFVSPTGTTDPADAANPMGRMYLNSVASLTTDDAMVITPIGEDATPQTVNISTVDSANGYIVAYENDDPEFFPKALSVGGSQAAIVGAARFASGDGSLSDFIDDVVFRSPSMANLGQSPWLISDDVASWSSAVAEAAGGDAWLLHRSYVFSKSVRAIEALKEEWKLYGLIPYLDASAKIAVRPMTFDTRDPLFEIDATNRVIDDGFGTVSGDDDGLVTVVVYKTGYDPIEDKSAGDTFVVQDMGAMARVKREAKLEIEPKSRAVGAEMTYEDAATRGKTITEIYGARSTRTVELDVSLKLFELLIGDQVLVTIPQLPGAGTRGIWTSGSGLNGRAGYVISRAWDLSQGRGTIRVLLHELSISGYTPSGHVTGATGATTAWTLNLDAGRYSGTNDVSFFTVGDAIRLYQFDSASPTIRYGVVSSVDVAGEKLDVTLTAAWGGLAGSEYLLMWQEANSATTVSTQLSAAYVANSIGQISTASAGQLPAVHFAP